MRGVRMILGLEVLGLMGGTFAILRHGFSDLKAGSASRVRAIQEDQRSSPDDPRHLAQRDRV
jgi:hypothetical protein